jgi:hypothetical protein
MKRVRAALAAGALIVASAGTAAVLSAGSASAEMAGWERIEQTGTVNGATTVTAFCTSGKKAMGGGYDVDQTDFLSSGSKVMTNKATGSGSGWTVTFSAGSNSFGVATVAVCATP